MPETVTAIGRQATREQQPRVTWRARHIYALAVGAAVFLAVLLLGFSAWFIWQARQGVLERTAASNQNLVRAVAQHAARTFEAVDTALGVVIAAMQTDGPSAQREASLQRLIEQRTAASPQIRSIIIVDADGRSILDSDARPARPLDASQREYFRAHLDHDGGLFISRPVLSAISGQWTIVLSRRIEDANGRLTGVVVAGLDPAYFQRSFADIDVGSRGAISLFLSDGSLLARQPLEPGLIGRNLSDQALFRDLLPRSPAGSTVVRSSLDGIERLLSYRSVEGFPLVVGVGASKDEVLTEWRRPALRDGCLAALLAITLVVFGHLLGRELHRRGMTENELKRQNAFLASILRTMPDGIQVVDRDLRMIGWNDQLFDILDVDRSAILSAPNPRLELLRRMVMRGDHGPGDVDKLIESRQVFPREGRPVHYRKQMATGKWIECRGTPVPELGYLAVYRDISAEIAREAELHRARDRLEAQATDLAAAAVSLEEARAKAEFERAAAEAASEASTRFLANMSHELRTPMTGVVGMVDFLLRTRLTPQQRQYVDTLHVSAETLLTVINDILDYSKIEAGKLTLEQIDFDLVARIEAVVQLLQPKASEKGILLKSALDPLMPRYLRGDPTRLQQVLFNLVGNAIKFTQHGSVDIACRAEPDSAGHLQVEIEVRDTGIGLSAEQQRRLFTPFSQGDDTTTRRFGGTGLGLAISRRLVEIMSGAIGVRSEPGSGAVFWISVPFRPGDPPASSESADGQVATRPMRLLLAEDNAVNRMLIAAGLERLGHSVTAVENGREAVDAMVRDAYDLVIMDMQMPVLDGIGATREIRAMAPPRGSVPVIGLSADAMPGHVDVYAAAGLSAYLLKPVDWRLLSRTLASFCASAPAESAPAADAAESGELAEPALPLLDESRLANVEEAMGRAKMLELLNMFPAIARDHAVTLGAAIARADAAGAKAAAHAIKGMAASLGAQRVAELARSYDDISNPPPPEMKHRLDVAIEATTQAIAALA